ncbi:MAG: DUF5117 domain-containing protein, partial [Flavisolibacter sp.]|nr:DUF5117 domain-containing protein [Flavisolibacter sp.]
MIQRVVMAFATTLLFSSCVATAQQAPASPAAPRAASSTGPKPYHEIITAKAVTDRGLFTTHRVDDKYYFEIPDSMMNREILVVNRISKAPAGARAGFLGFAGDQISDNVISFERGPNNRVFLRTISYSERGSDSAGMYQSVRNSNLQPINASFDIKAYASDSISRARSTVIEVTDYLMGDNEIFFFGQRVKRSLGLTSYQRDNSYIMEIRSFPGNIEVRTVKTFMRTPPPQPGQPSISGQTGSPTTFELNSSMVLLPTVAMKPRYFDPRVGYFATSYTDFDLNPQGVERIRMITR